MDDTGSAATGSASARPAPAELLPARVRAPGSTSNLGAGFDCLGLALGLHLDARFSPGPAPLRIERGGTLGELTGDDALARAFRNALAADGIVPTGLLQITSEIPVARGMGSSATAVVAGLALAARALGRTIDLDRTLAAATRIEGHPDNAAPALLGGLVAVAPDAAGAPHPFRLPLSAAVAFAWAAPEVEVVTAAARAALPENVAHATAARSLARTAALLHGLATADPDLLRIGFQDELHVPWRLALIPGGELAMRAATDAGAWAVTISGSGSGLLAVCAPGDDPAVATAMGDAFRQHATDPGARDAVFARAVRPDSTGLQVLHP